MTEEQTPEIEPTTQDLIENGIGEVSRLYVDQVLENERLREGATLRDWFAMSALPTLMRQENNVGWGNWAKSAYEIADMMMKARKAGKEIK